MADSPEAPATAVQDPPGTSESVADAITAAMAAASSDHPAAPDPEAERAPGTGEDAPSPAPEAEGGESAPPEAGGESAEDEPPGWIDAAGEVKWDDESERTAFVQSLLDKQQEEAAADAARRLADQSRNLTADLRASEATRREQEALLEELDELSETNPAEYRDRLNSDAKAAAAVLARTAAQNRNPLDEARMVIAAEHAQQMLNAVPWMESVLEELSEQGEEALRAALDPTKGGMFSLIAERAAQRGEQEIIDRYKQSAEFTAEIERASSEAVHTALQGRGGGGPPAQQQDARPAGGTPGQISTGDDLKDAMAQAAQEHGITVDLGAVKAPRIAGTGAREGT